MDVAAKNDLEVISGIELSSEINGRDVHVLGYCFDHTDIEFKKSVQNMQDTRIPRMEQMIEKLKELGKITDVSRALSDPIKSLGVLTDFANSVCFRLKITIIFCP